MNKERFLRDDYKTYKPKFVLCCKDCKTEKLINTFGSLNIKPYICKVKITDIEKWRIKYFFGGGNMFIGRCFTETMNLVLDGHD